MVEKNMPIKMGNNLLADCGVGNLNKKTVEQLNKKKHHLAHCDTQTKMVDDPRQHKIISWMIIYIVESSGETPTALIFEPISCYNILI